MAGSATFARDAGIASSASRLLDTAAGLAASIDAATRSLVGTLVESWSTSGWLAAGCVDAAQWLRAYTPLSGPEAHRLVSVAGLCAGRPVLADAVGDGVLSVSRAAVLAKAVTPERDRFLSDDTVDAFVRLAGSTSDDGNFSAAVRFWSERADEQVAPRRELRHSLTMAPRLFGGGQIHGELSGGAFETFCAAIDAFIQDPDPVDAPYRRTISERRADALDDLSAHALSHECAGDGPVEELADEVDDFGDFGDDASTDDLDVELDHPDLDPMDLLRLQVRARELRRRKRRRRRVKPRSGVTTNVHVDVRTFLEQRDIGDFDGLVARGEHWDLTRSTMDRLLCDSATVTTLFAGPNRLLDANDAAEQWSRAQRRAIGARDRGCVFPACRRPPRHCDIHHLHERSRGGPTRTTNGAMLCRFHHRLVHTHGWRLERDHRAWSAIDPHGTTWTGRSITDQRVV